MFAAGFACGVVVTLIAVVWLSWRHGRGTE